MAQVVEHWPNKCETLNSISSPPPAPYKETKKQYIEMYLKDMAQSTQSLPL
jgi:hypothetical protein